MTDLKKWLIILAAIFSLTLFFNVRFTSQDHSLRKQFVLDNEGEYKRYMRSLDIITADHERATQLIETLYKQAINDFNGSSSEMKRLKTDYVDALIYLSDDLTKRIDAINAPPEFRQDIMTLIKIRGTQVLLFLVSLSLLVIGSLYIWNRMGKS